MRYGKYRRATETSPDGRRLCVGKPSAGPLGAQRGIGRNPNIPRVPYGHYAPLCRAGLGHACSIGEGRTHVGCCEQCCSWSPLRVYISPKALLFSTLLALKTGRPRPKTGLLLGRNPSENQSSFVNFAIKCPAPAKWQAGSGNRPVYFEADADTETGQAIRYCTLEKPITPWIRNTERKYRK